MKIDGDKFESLLWDAGIETRLAEEKDEDITFVDIPEHGLRVGYAWNNVDLEGGSWYFDIGDVEVFTPEGFYCQSEAESAEELVEELLKLIDH